MLAVATAHATRALVGGVRATLAFAGVGGPCVRRGYWVPRAAFVSSGLVVFCFFLRRCSAVSAFFVPRWRCCFAAWLSVPGRRFSFCAGAACPFRVFCSGRASLVPGSSCSLSSAAVWAFPAVVASRRDVCLRWLWRAGLPRGVGGLGWVSPAWALPFPSVLSAASRAGFPFARFWRWLLALRRLRR